MEGVYVDEREDVQKKTFAKWINSQLVKRNLPPISDLFQDLQDGNHLLTLLEILTGKEFKREKGKMRVHHLNNVNKALQILEQNNVKLVNISSNDIVDGSPKLTLGLVWSIILHWQVHYHLKDLMSELQQTNLEKTLLAWCRLNTKNYQGVDINNFSTSWSDGLAFNALIHRWYPDLFQFSTVSKMHPNARLEHAFRVAQELHGIERLLDPEDVNTSQPDKKSIMMYVMCLFQSIPHSEVDADCLDFSIHSDNSSLASPVVEMRSPEGFSAGMLGVPTSRPLSMATNVSVELGGYQRALEDVLTWLLEAEDTLANPLEDDDTLDQIKEQFNAHEQFLLKLAKHQSSVASVLEEGAHMLQEGGLSRDEEDEVRIQMQLLNSRWEDLRVKAMQRQSKIHEVLMQRQQRELDHFRQWLTVTEDRISRMAEVGPTFSALTKQVVQHPIFQADLVKQEKCIETLSNMVVVVDDENNLDNVDTQMEDQLTALSERWAHICKWSEERWTLLQDLNSAWERVSLQCLELQRWLDLKEKLLKGMEADPALEIGQVLERIKTLQMARREMTSLQVELESVQEETFVLDKKLRSGWTGEIQERIETIQDRWDALMQIIEVQAQRICDAGFEFNLNGGPMEDHDTNTSSEPKRRRTGTVKRVKFESALDQLRTFMERAETLLEGVGAVSHVPSPELKQSLEDTIQETASRQADLQKLIRLGHELIIEMQAEGSGDDAVHTERQKWINAEQRLTQLDLNLRGSCDLVQFNQDVTTVKNDLSSISVLLDGNRKWLERIDTAPKSHSPSVLADQMRVKLKSMRSQDDKVSRLKTLAQRIGENDRVDRQLVQDACQLSDRWAQLQQTYIDRQAQLSGGGPVTSDSVEVSDRTSQKQSKVTSVIKDITDWVHATESTLLSDHVTLAELPVMEEQFGRFEDLQKALKEKEKMLSEVSKEGHGQELIELSTRCSDIAAILHERQMKLQPYLDGMRQFSEEVAGLAAWLFDVESFLQDEKHLPVGDLETLEAQLEQSNALQEDIETLERNIQNMTLSVSQLKGNADDPFIAQLDAKHNAVLNKWNSTIKCAKEHNVSLKTALEKSKMVVKGIEEFFSWLADIEKDIPAFGNASSSAELFQLKGKYQFLKDKVDLRTDGFRQLNELGNDLMLSSEGPTVQELARRITQLNSKWTEVTDTIFDKHRILQDASLQYGEFKALVAQEMDWLDKLEKRLRKSPKSAADAEEISEELDDLENYIRNHPDTRLTRIQEIGQALEDDGVMSETVKAEVSATTNRWNLLSQQARDRTVLLEVSAAEAQESEGQILELQDWLEHVDALLTARLKNNTFEDDDQHLADEFETQGKTLKEMSEQVSAYEKAGKVEAASRLRDQMILLEKRFSEVRLRFQHFRNGTSYLEQRLSRVLRELRGVEEATCLLDIASDDPEGIEGQLKHCVRFYRTLSDLKGEVETIIKRGRQAVKENSIPDPEKLTARLDSLKELYNKLGSQIADSKESLENARELSLSLQKDIPALNEWMDMVESELDEREALPIARRDLESEKAFLKELLEEEVPQWQAMRDRVGAAYKSFSLICDPVYLEALQERVGDVMRRWDRVIERTVNTRAAVEGLEQVSNHSPASKTAQLQASMKQTENIPAVPQMEVSEWRPPEPLETECIGIGNPGFEDFEEDTLSAGFTNYSKADESNRVRSDKEVLSEEVGGDIKSLSHLGTDYVATVRPEREALGDTFRLDKDSTLFNQVSTNTLPPPVANEGRYHEPVEQKVQMVEIKALEIVKSVVTAVESMEVYPSSSCHLGPQTVEMVEILEDTEESAPDTDSESPAIIRRTSPLPVHVKSFSEILLKGGGNKPSELSRNFDSFKPVQVVEIKNGSERTPSLCLEMTDRVNRMEETTLTAWRRFDPSHSSSGCENDEGNQNGPKVTLRKEIEVSKTYQVIGSYSPGPSGLKGKKPKNYSRGPEVSDRGLSELKGGKRSVSTTLESKVCAELQDDIKRVKREHVESDESDEESFYGSDKETDDVVEFSDDESSIAAVSSHATCDGVEDDSSSSDDEDPALSRRIASGQSKEEVLEKAAVNNGALLLPRLHLKAPLIPVQKKLLLEKIKNFYFEDQKLTLSGIVDLMGDELLIHGIYAASRWHAIHATSQAPVFLYYFNRETFNGINVLVGIQALNGSGHADDLGYVFKMNAANNIPESMITLDPKKLTKERNQMTELISNFVQHGNPTPNKTDSLNVTWPPANVHGGRYLYIADELEVKENLLKGRMSFWDEVLYGLTSDPFYKYERQLVK